MRVPVEADLVVVYGLLLTVAIGLGTIACSVPEPTADAERAAMVEEPEEQEGADAEGVVEAHKALIRAYETADSQAFEALLDPSGELMIFHPLLENRFDGIESVREGLESMLARLGGATWTDVHPMVVVKGDVAWLTSHVLVSSEKLEGDYVGRGTEIWVRSEDGWRLAHAHWSEHPGIHAE